MAALLAVTIGSIAVVSTRLVHYEVRKLEMDLHHGPPLPSGDSLRNFVHDLKLPLFFLIGVRSYYAHQQGKTADTCPVFTEPILQAWRLPYVVLDHRHGPADLAAAYQLARAERRAGAALLAE